MDEVKDKTVRTGMPILFGVGDIFEGGYGREQLLSQGTWDKLIRPPDAFCRANLESNAVLVQSSWVHWGPNHASIPVSGSRRAAYPSSSSNTYLILRY